MKNIIPLPEGPWVCMVHGLLSRIPEQWSNFTIVIPAHLELLEQF